MQHIFSLTLQVITPVLREKTDAIHSLSFFSVGGPQATTGHRKIPVYWNYFTSGLSFKVGILDQHFWSAFATSSSSHQASSSRRIIQQQDQFVLERACVGALSEGNMVGATHVMRKVQPFRVDCTLCRIKQMLVLKMDDR